MRIVSIAPLVLVGIAVSGQPASAQSLSFLQFDRLLEAIRVEAGIPGLSAAIVENGVVVWEFGKGKQDIESNIAATPATPYQIGQLSQAFGSTVLLRKCMDQSYAELTDRVRRWTPEYPEAATTLGELLSHTAPGGGYRYAPERFAALTGVAEECGDKRYGQMLVEEVFELAGMLDSVPGQSFLTPSSDDTFFFGAPRVTRYASTLRTIAVPYRVVNRRPQRNPDYQAPALDASDGIVTTVRDLARFDAALDAGVLLDEVTRTMAWQPAISGLAALPTGLGWFVQGYNGQPVIWQFGRIDGAYSSLIVKIPNRHLTFIALANSDGLSAPYALDAGDVTNSLFAKLFLKTFVP